MRAIVLTSNGLRHAYFAQTVARHLNLLGVIKESKGDYYSSERAASALVKSHFNSLNETEKRFFGSTQWPEVPTLELEKNDINSADSIGWAVNLSPDFVFLFGTTILNDEWLEKFPDRIVNLHLGLSPYYRGSATLFWPIVNDELECVGATFHLAERRVDAGRILSRIKPTLEIGDTYYTINYKTIKKAIDNLPVVARKYADGRITPLIQDLRKGLVYRKKDFNEDALQAALDLLAGGVSAQKLKSISGSNKCACS